MEDEVQRKKRIVPFIANKALSRRHFILSSTAVMGAGIVLSFPKLTLAQETNNNAKDKSITNIHHMAEFVTAKKISPSLAQRAGWAITKTDAQFPDHIEALAEFITKNNITDIEALQDAPGFDGDIKIAAQKLISALYLGYAGQPVELSSEDNVEFVAYREALTYQLTQKYTPIPTYSRWSTGYWAHLPSE
ncbi:hypothetical protein GT348_07355 [Aristophania vespae]|uniref:Uncharacterized protein n=1 Tax=Aristophania vespae TaxID=2697033 RepID=A0A6P1NF41_9PROT|nr:sugar dehydrogenase complex small subunit [Aristophania vespae]QHI96078.1 hypothetical protein GT348_07355 [Aristophania vespae]